ncbi:kinase-like domain-containing protein [Gymnopilus junonius]|uniref:non-specific serine/threonine protein kinase n=1 Tax=Gymnopilus junonius TaxID=109634 RepID=A0A9P5NQK8_GYMJU|nr:kinase-like domain-containing protein [Gymnopilus junonius]
MPHGFFLDLLMTNIKPSNILLVPPCDPALFFAQISSSRDAPGEMAIGRNNEGLPIVRARSQALLYPFPACDPNSKIAWEKTSVKLADVGVACWADKVPEHFTDLIQNPALRAPEVCIGSGWGKPADLWSLGCTIYELVMGQSMIKEDVIPESVPYLHTLRFGDYPLEMIKQGKYSKIFFNNEGSLRILLPQRSSLKSMVYSNGPPLNADAFIDFLQHMLMLDPKKRASCQELLAHEWLKR